MAKISTVESNIVASFDKVRSDILLLNNEIRKVASDMELMKQELSRLYQNYSDMNAQVSSEARKDDSGAKVEGAKKLAELRQKIEQLKKERSKAQKSKVIVKKVSARAATKFVASKTGKKFHKPNCIFAKNIKPKSRVIYKTKDGALNAGYKACHCVLK